MRGIETLEVVGNELRERELLVADGLNNALRKLVAAEIVVVGVVDFSAGGGESLVAVQTAVQGYLIIFSAIGGLFAGFVESDTWQGVAYALFCAPVSLAVFSIFS